MQIEFRLKKVSKNISLKLKYVIESLYKIF